MPKTYHNNIPGQSVSGTSTFFIALKNLMSTAEDPFLTVCLEKNGDQWNIKIEAHDKCDRQHHGNCTVTGSMDQDFGFSEEKAITETKKLGKYIALAFGQDEVATCPLSDSAVSN